MKTVLLTSFKGERGCLLRANALIPARKAAAVKIQCRALPQPTTTPDETGAPRMVNWYPGHIARAERQLKEQLNMVDVVFEVRDARVLMSTEHPQVPDWTRDRARLIVINRMDMISDQDRKLWQDHFSATGAEVFWTDGQAGHGISRLRRAAVEVGKRLNEKRTKRGLKARSVRGALIGFPNVGKSAIINRLVGRRVCDSAPKPGVTRTLKWVRLEESELDLLDAPGILPMRFDNQLAASSLAIVNDIGEASYVDSLVAAALIDRMRKLPRSEILVKRIEERYGLTPGSIAGQSSEDVVAAVGERLFQGEMERAGQRILRDYREGAMGVFALELPAAARR